MKRERIEELKKIINEDSFLRYLLKSNNVKIDEFIEIMITRNIKYNLRVSKERALILILDDEGLEDLKLYYGDKPRVPFWEVEEYLKINREQLELLVELNYLRENSVTYEEFEYYHKGAKENRKGLCFSDKIYKLEKAEVKKYLKEIMPKGYRIRVETGSREDLKIIEKNLKKVFVIEKFQEYEKRESGYMNYSRITPKDLENKNFENRLVLENTRLQEELKKIYKELKDL